MNSKEEEKEKRILLDIGNPLKVRCTTCKYFGKAITGHGPSPACRLNPEPVHLVNRLETHWCHQYEEKLWTL